MGILHVMEKPVNYTSVDQDGLWKKVIGDLFEQFVYYFLPDLYDEVNFDKPVDFLDHELFKIVRDRRKGLKRADKLVKVHLKSGGERWVLVHVEVQGQDEVDFAQRMFRYFYRLYDKHQTDIVAFALFTNMSTKSTDTFDYACFGTQLTYRFNKYVLGHTDDRQLKASTKLFSKVLLAAYYFNYTKHDEELRFAYKEELLKEVTLLKGYNENEISALFYFIDYLLALPEALSERLKEEIQTFIHEEGFDMAELRKEEMSPTLAAIAESFEKKGMERGIEQAKVATARNLISLGIDDEVIVKATGLSVEQLNILRLNPSE